MADGPKRSSRSSSTGATRKDGSKAPAAAAASSGGSTAAEKPDTAAAAAATASPAAAPAAAPSPRPSEPPRPAPSAYAPPPPPAAQSSSSGGVAVAGLIAGVIGIVLALTYPQWTPIVYGSTGSETRVTADQVRAEMRAEVETLKATMASMVGKQVSLEQAVRTAKLPGVLMVAEDLRAALGDSEPYAGTLNLFRSLTGEDAEAALIIAAVADRAEVGVPGVSEVQDGFDEVAHAILMAEQRPQASGDLASQVSDTVASLAAATMRLRWRLDGAPSGDSVPAVVARAEQAVLNGEFVAAIDTLNLLPEERRAAADPWVEMVRARMQAETVREQLDAYIISMAAQIQ